MNCQKCNKHFDESDLRILRQCKHRFCPECLVNYLKNFENCKIKCLIPNCNKFISDKLLRECFSNDQIKIYEELSNCKSSPSIVKCLTEGCQYFVNFTGDGIVFECDFCMAPNCTKCKARHYPNDCGKQNLVENVIESRAREFLKKRKRKEVQNIQKKYDLLPNPDSFECSICLSFVLPRAGTILRNCLHCFCSNCLKNTYDNIKYSREMTCPDEKCGRPLDTKEIFVLLNEDRILKMIKVEAGSRLFQCKNGDDDCQGVWDVISHRGEHQCHECGRINCLSCKDIHEGETCEMFRRTKRYISQQDMDKVLKRTENVKCYLCNKLLVRKGGCGSLYCDKCGNHTCLFTGKISGTHDPQKCFCLNEEKCLKIDLYCGCFAKIPCHKNCLKGCYPE